MRCAFPYKGFHRWGGPVYVFEDSRFTEGAPQIYVWSKFGGPRGGPLDNSPQRKMEQEEPFSFGTTCRRDRRAGLQIDSKSKFGGPGRGDFRRHEIYFFCKSGPPLFTLRTNRVCGEGAPRQNGIDIETTNSLPRAVERLGHLSKKLLRIVLLALARSAMGRV